MQQKLSSKVIQCLISICRWFFKLKRNFYLSPRAQKIHNKPSPLTAKPSNSCGVEQIGIACISERKPKVTIGFKYLHMHKLCKSVQQNNKLFSVPHIFLPSSVKTHLSEFYFSLS